MPVDENLRAAADGMREIARNLIRGDLELRARSLRQDTDQPTLYLARRMHGRFRLFLNVSETQRLLWLFRVRDRHFVAAEVELDSEIEPERSPGRQSTAGLTTTLSPPPFLQYPGRSDAAALRLADGRRMRIEPAGDGQPTAIFEGERAAVDDWPKHWFPPLLRTVMTWNPDKAAHPPVPPDESAVELLGPILEWIRAGYRSVVDLANRPEAEEQLAPLHRRLISVHPAFIGHHLSGLSARIRVWLDEHGQLAHRPGIGDTTQRLKVDFSTRLVGTAERPELRITPRPPDVLHSGVLYERLLRAARAERIVDERLARAFRDRFAPLIRTVGRWGLRILLDTEHEGTEPPVFTRIGRVPLPLDERDVDLLWLRGRIGTRSVWLLYELNMKVPDEAPPEITGARLLAADDGHEARYASDPWFGGSPWDPLRRYTQALLHTILAWQAAMRA